MMFTQTGALHTQLGTQPLRLRWARGVWSRFRGLMLTRPLKRMPEAQGLLITRCPSVHGFFMLYSLDIVYLASEEDRFGKQAFSVTHTARLFPWTVSFGRSHTVHSAGGALKKRSAHALELPAGSIRALGIQPGDTLEITS
jgi:uncharacterized membrane protein (UPF0127 family)